MNLYFFSQPQLRTEATEYIQAYPDHVEYVGPLLAAAGRG
jgi:hypothetical protein